MKTNLGEQISICNYKSASKPLNQGHLTIVQSKNKARVKIDGDRIGPNFIDMSLHIHVKGVPKGVLALDWSRIQGVLAGPLTFKLLIMVVYNVCNIKIF